MLRKNNIVKSASFISNALDVQNYDQASHYAKLLTTSFCGIKNRDTPKLFQSASKVQKLIRQLGHSGKMIQLNERDTKLKKQIKNELINLY